MVSFCPKCYIIGILLAFSSNGKDVFLGVEERR
jgi:hypothetical protein